MKRTAGAVELSPQDLPFSCPPARQRDKWNSHPRVFLPLTPRSPETSCPYCGTRYVLRGGDNEGAGADGGKS